MIAVDQRHPSTEALRHPVRALWEAMSAQKRELGLAGFLGALASGSTVALLGVSAWLIATASQMPPVLTLTVAAALVRTLAISRSAFRYLERLVGHDAAFRGLTELRVTVYRALERLAPTGLRSFGRGDLLARLVADVDAALDLPLRVVLPWVQAALVAGVTVGFLAWLLPSTGVLVGVLAIIALALVPWLIATTSRSAERRMAPARAGLSDAVVRSLDATAELAAFGAAPLAVARVRTLDDRLTRLNLREAYSLGLGGGVGTVVQGAAVVGALVLSVPAVVSGRIEPVWLAVAALLPLVLFDILATLPGSALAYQRLRGSAVRLAEIEATPSPVTDPAQPRPIPVGFAGLEAREVSAHWTPGRSVLHDVSFRVAPGERVAIVGPSGSGKSTLAAVLMGFLPYAGSITLSGTEVREADGDDVRRHVGLLTQDAHVFDTTIADNIRIGDPEATDAAISAAAAAAQLDPWTSTLPLGLETAVGAFGSAVSGGERQRIALARLLLAERPLVILDEPTEHLDGATADALMATLSSSLRDSTVLLITHRLRGVEEFDRILQLGDGHVVAEGTHEELMRLDGWYAEQWTLESERQDMARLLSRLPIGRAVPAP